MKTWRSRAIEIVRILFSAWIAFLGVATFFNTYSGADIHGHTLPTPLVPSIAAVEAVFAIAFAFHPGGLALAGLCASFAGAIVLHAMLGQIAWHVFVFLAITLILYLANPFDRSSVKNSEEQP